MKFKIFFISGYASSFNYSDFENDTSSPFDNVELKTINDLDILAQVLNTLQTNDTHTPETTSTESTASSDNTPVQQQKTILPNDNTIDPNSHFYQQPTNETTIGYGSMTANQTERLTEFPRYATTYQTNENYYNFDNRNKQTQHLSNAVDVLPTTVIPNNEFYYNSPTMGPNSYNLTNHNFNVHVGYNMNNVDSAIQTAYNSSAMVTGHLEKSKSKSVPDILKELNDELRNSEMKRQRNNSQSIASPTDGKRKFSSI